MAWDTSSVDIGRSTKKSDYDRLRLNDQVIASGTFSFYGRKNFNGGARCSSATSLVTQVKLRSGSINYGLGIYEYVLPIGPWNMDANAEKQITFPSFPSYYSSGNQSYVNRIVDFSVMIKPDQLNNYMYPFFHSVVDQSGTDTMHGAVTYIGTSSINLLRRTGGFFDNSNFDTSGSYNRGWIFFKIMKES